MLGRRQHNTRSIYAKDHSQADDVPTVAAQEAMTHTRRPMLGMQESRQQMQDDQAETVQ
jgi:hypothetical protein